MRTKGSVLLSFVFLITTIALHSFTHANPDYEPPSTLNLQWSVLYHKGSSNDLLPHTLCTIHLKQVPIHFPDFCQVREKHRYELGKLQAFYTTSFHKPEIVSVTTESPYHFFESLIEGDTYSYVLFDDKLVFTSRQEDSCAAIQKCRANKHLFLSGQREFVRMAGEFQVLRHPSKDQLFVVVNNNSGTYIPTSEKTQALVALLKQNMVDPAVRFIGIDRDETFDLINILH